MVPSPPMSPRIVRRIAVLVVGLALVASACSSGPSSSTAGPDDATTTTLLAPSPYVSSFATARKPTLTVLTSPPAGITTSTTPNGSTPTPSRSGLPAIPRTGLNSAGVKKAADGIEYTNPTYYKNPLVVQVLDNQGDWLHVLVTARPNHTEGWVRADDVTLGATEFRLELDLSTFTLRVYKAATVFLETPVAIGRESTPTPVGRFFMTEIIKNPNDTTIYGAYILATNGYSETLDTFDGGLPQIAFHGTNQPELLGTKASNGCVRMSNEAVTRIAQNVPAGAPIEIFATRPPSWSTA